MSACSMYPMGRADLGGKVQGPFKMVLCLWQRQQISMERSECAVGGGHPLAVIDLLGDVQSLPGTLQRARIAALWPRADRQEDERVCFTSALLRLARMCRASSPSDVTSD